MIKKLLLFIKNHKHSNSIVFIFLFVIAFFIRFPFFFRDYIDRDESTFILIGQSWVEGFLPYTELWDIKPPLTFLFFAGVIGVFGKSFFAIRLLGTLMVSLTAFFTYKIGKTLTSSKIAFVTGIVCVGLQSMFGSIQGVMSEHLCMAFLTPAVFILIKYKKWYWLALSGLLMGTAIMIKLNIAYTILFLGLYLIYHFINTKQFQKGVLGVASYGLGILVIIALTLLPYYLKGLTELWWKSVVIAPLDYAGARRSSIFKLLPIFLAILIFFYFAWKKKYLNFRTSAVQILIISILGILYSFIQGGRINSHYLIQLYPLFVVLFTVVFFKVATFFQIKWRKAYLWVLLVLPAESYLEYYNIISHKIEKGSFYNGEGITVPQYLKANAINTENIFFAEYHIGYWVLNQKPPTKAATHPSNICKPEMFSAYDNPRKTTMQELRFIMEKKRPKTVVSRKNRRFFDKEQKAANAYLKNYLQRFYKIQAEVDNAVIYTLLE